ncbi:MAG: hypothetical protein H6983_26575 [Ectothiorhodospiraceae bacterium]|nr:hypothetical protein [Ectothiorhodospiraceae bacterium]
MLDIIKKADICGLTDHCTCTPTAALARRLEAELVDVLTYLLVLAHDSIDMAAVEAKQAVCVERWGKPANVGRRPWWRRTSFAAQMSGQWVCHRAAAGMRPAATAGDGRQPGDVDWHPLVCLEVWRSGVVRWPSWESCQAVAEQSRGHGGASGGAARVASPIRVECRWIPHSWALVLGGRNRQPVRRRRSAVDRHHPSPGSWLRWSATDALRPDRRWVERGAANRIGFAAATVALMVGTPLLVWLAAHQPGRLQCGDRLNCPTGVRPGPQSPGSSPTSRSTRVRDAGADQQPDPHGRPVARALRGHHWLPKRWCAGTANRWYVPADDTNHSAVCLACGQTAIMRRPRVEWLPTTQRTTAGSGGGVAGYWFAGWYKTAIDHCLLCVGGTRRPVWAHGGVAVLLIGGGSSAPELVDACHLDDEYNG